MSRCKNGSKQAVFNERFDPTSFDFEEQLKRYPKIFDE